MATRRVNSMFRGLFLGYTGFLLLFGSEVESVMISEQPGVPSACYSIPESRARLSAKDKIEAIDLNFTEIGLSYIELYEELEMISMKNFEYLDGNYVEMNCTLIDIYKKN